MGSSKPARAWAIRPPWTDAILVYAIGRIRKDVWENASRETGESINQLRAWGYRAVRVTVTEEEKPS